MQLDDRAINFIQNAKAQGFSKEQVAQFLQDKGYDMGISNDTPQQPQPQETKDPYSALDKAKYTLRAGGEGLTFGLGDVVAGLTNANITPVVYALETIKGNKKFDLNDYNPLKNFKEGRKDFVNEQEAFAKAHPALNFVGELGGGLITGVAGAGKKLVATGAKQGLKQLAKQGAKEGAKFGGAYGFGSGLTQDADRFSVANALKGGASGAVGGAILGAGLPLAIGGAGKVGQKGINAINYLKNKEINSIRKVAGEDLGKAIAEGRPLIDFANEGTLDLALGTKQADPKASQVYVNYARERLRGQRPIINQMLKNTFGEKGSNQLLDELNAEVLKGSKVLYDRAVYQTDKAGNVLLDQAGRPISKIVPELEKLNKYELDYVGKVYRTKGLEYEVQGLPQNDMRILNYAKQLMDDDIQRLTNQGQNAQARILAEKRAQFISKIDKANPEYKTARAFYERGKQAEDALQAGRNFDKGNRENLQYSFNKLTPEQQAFYRLGAGDRIAEHTNIKTEGGNIAQRVFDAETMRRLKTIGVKDVDKLAEQAKKESITAANLQRLLQGSQTAEKQASVGRWATNPTRQAKGVIARTIDNLYGKVVNPNAEQVAKMLTDPQYLRYMLNRSKTNTIQNALKGNYSAVAGNVSKALKDAKKQVNNEGGFVRVSGKPKVSQILNSEGKPVANTEEGVKNFQKWFGNSKVVDEKGRPLALADGDNIYKIDGYSDTGVGKYTYKGSHRAPSFDDTKISERIDNGGDFNLKEVLKGYHQQPQDYFTPNGARIYGYDDKAGLESLNAIRQAGNGNKKITAYRAVPKDVGQTKLNNGDWISFSKEYADNHGKYHIDGDYKIIEQEVSPKDVWWDGNDIREWGFDNGKGKSLEKELYLNIKNPKYQNSIPTSQEEARILGEQGYDGVITPDGKYFVFSINQIKNKNNTTFDPKNPNIYKSLIGAGGLGSIAQILNNKEAK